MSVDQYPYGDNLRAGLRKGPRKVGASWLLDKNGNPMVETPSDIAPGLRVDELSHREATTEFARGENVSVMAASKRRRGELNMGTGAMRMLPLPMEGYHFTWEKGKGTLACIEEKLDKVLAFNVWREIVPGARVTNTLMRKSDHSTLFLSIHEMFQNGGGGKRGFRFEMAWVYHEGCRGVVERSWEEGRNEGIQEGRTDPASLTEFQRLEGILSNMEIQEDTYWRQRAKQHWLKNADATNTKFYHIHIFSTSNPMDGSNLFAEVSPRVTQAQNELLLRPFEVSELKDALFAMAADKTPGPDGMNPGFYQQFWDVVGDDILTFILNCLNNRIFPSELNNTDVVLIPKKKTPEVVADFWPIALSNVIYRIMAKMITQRMKPLMESIISSSQNAFIPDRLITDNIFIAAEVGHYLNRKQCGTVGWGALKLDMAKAYDRMEWPFLRGMLLALGFDDRWIELIMLCVTTVSYTFMINGSRSTSITPTRGLRQGDPLSPYLFIICAEGLSVLLQQAQDRGLIHGCRVARGAPPISHLFFADDILLFFNANMPETYEIKHCLSLYESLSCQKVNYHKSNVCYSRNTGQYDKDMLEQILGVTQAPNFGKYLGLPSFVGRNKMAVFAYIEDKIRQRIGSWNKKLLSQAAIERAMNRYWWGTGTDRGIHWKAWDKLCIPKKHGGLGFKDLRAFNLAMLGKQAWRLLTNTDSLVARVYKARIQRIPVTPEYEDIWYWYEDPNGCYSVKNGYRRIVGNYEDNSNGAFDKWLALWNCNIIPSMESPKRCGLGCLSTKTNEILLVTVAATVKAWEAIHHRIPTRQAARQSAPTSEVVAAAPTAGNILPTDAVIMPIAGRPPSPPRSHPALPRGTMTRPRKCYIDASYHHGTNAATVGAVLLDADDRYVSAFSAPLIGCFSPLMAETFACKEALSWLRRRDEQFIQIHTDCQLLQSYLSGPPTTSRSYLRYAIDSC
ncbi:PREDICTED: uncharacterized protein LOC109166713 [Ipomoea nil]|uniref:uncharacterized protein LOC109166713 n=1 Tax=Ipomoea nil TaxID=35883 RepID=UPI000900A178|nr:PREDICTED: uncharacterized protein LOC109166713 [Ipomoea nil]